MEGFILNFENVRIFFVMMKKNKFFFYREDLWNIEVEILSFVLLRFLDIVIKLLSSICNFL